MVNYSFKEYTFMVMNNIADPVLALGDLSCGLDISGYKLVPNDALMSIINVYTPEIIEAILSDHLEIVDTWLSKLHERYLMLKKSCELDSNPVACFNIPPLEQFETHFQLWQDGGIVTISIGGGEVIRIRNEKRGQKERRAAASLVTDETENSHFICSMCSSTFSDSEEYYRHRLHEIESAKNKQNQPDRIAEIGFTREKIDIPPNPIWWLES